MPSNNFSATFLILSLLLATIPSTIGEKCHCGKKEQNNAELREFYKKLPNEKDEPKNSNKIDEMLEKLFDLEVKEFKKDENSKEKFPPEALLLKANTWEMSKLEDNLIYHASPIDAKFGSKCVAVKIIKFDNLVERKPRDYVEHELEMLKMAKQAEIGAVVELVGGYSLHNAVFMMLELGEMDLGKYLEGKKKMNLQIDLLELFSVMANRLAQMHKIAIHNALKPSNWVTIKNDGNGKTNSELNLKLIDLQTAIPVRREDGVVQNPLKYRKFICRASPREHEARSLREASPEMVQFCQSTNENDEPKEKQGIKIWKKNSLPKLSTKSDVWALGVVFCEISFLIFPKMLDGLVKENGGAKHEMKPFERIVHAFYGKSTGKGVQGLWKNAQNALLKRRRKNGENIGEKLNEAILARIQAQMPFLFPVLQAIFKKNAKVRPSAATISKYFKRIKKLAINSNISEAKKNWAEIYAGK